MIQVLKLFATEDFDVPITDLHMPSPSGGYGDAPLQPDALILLVSGYTDVKSAMEATFLEADEILVEPFEIGKLADVSPRKDVARKLAARKSGLDITALHKPYCGGLVSAGKKEQRTHLRDLTGQERTGYLPKLIEDLIVRQRKPNISGTEGDSICSTAAAAHGKMRQLQRYTPGMLVHDSRIQATLFGTL